MDYAISCFSDRFQQVKVFTEQIGFLFEYVSNTKTWTVSDSDNVKTQCINLFHFISLHFICLQHTKKLRNW